MDNVLLFVTGVLSGLIAGFILSRIFGRTKIRSDGSTEWLLQERLLKADEGLKKFSDELEAYKKSQNFVNMSKSPHEVIKSLMETLISCMEKNYTTI